MNAKNIKVREKSCTAEKKEKGTPEKKIERENEERERYKSSKGKRKQILGETMKSGSITKDKCANENTI